MRRLTRCFYRQESLPEHPNGMRFIARDSQNTPLSTKTYFSVGGGFVVDDPAPSAEHLKPTALTLEFPYRTGDDLLRLARESQLSISEMTRQRNPAGGRRPKRAPHFAARVASDAEVRRTWLPQRRRAAGRAEDRAACPQTFPRTGAAGSRKPQRTIRS